MEKIRVLFITHAPWRNDTSIGNSYSNIFNNMGDKLEFAQIYVRDGKPENNLVNKYFCISEKQLLKSVFTRRKVGKAVQFDNTVNSKKIEFSKNYNRIRSLRWDFFLLGRDVATSLGNWKTKELDDFLTGYNPDIIFGALSFIPLINKLMIYAKSRTGAKLVVYPWDDWYNINHYSVSPFYYIRILIERYYIKRCVVQCSFMYTITEQMKEEYQKLFNKNCKVLRKGFDILSAPRLSVNIIDKISLVYVGNIGDNRWKVLAEIARTIQQINIKNKISFTQYIYTLSPITGGIRKLLEVEGASKLMGAATSKDIPVIMGNADILIHVEPTDKERLENCRLSFSTKIVDYLYQGKCILAVGGENASMRYLKENDAAIVINDISKLKDEILNLANKPEIIAEYGIKARNCGVKNHDINKIQQMIYNDFMAVTKIG